MTAHKRIRPFNTKETYPEQKLDNDLCQAVVAKGTMVFLRGQVGVGATARIDEGDRILRGHRLAVRPVVVVAQQDEQDLSGDGARGVADVEEDRQ